MSRKKPTRLRPREGGVMRSVVVGARVAWLFGDKMRCGFVTSFRWHENGARAHIECGECGSHSVDVELLFPISDEVKG